MQETSIVNKFIFYLNRTKNMAHSASFSW